jgi:hypothetical protein
MAPLGPDIKGCAFSTLRGQSMTTTPKSPKDKGLFRCTTPTFLIKNYWGIGATTHYFRPQIRKTTPVEFLKTVMGVVD